MGYVFGILIFIALVIVAGFIALQVSKQNKSRQKNKGSIIAASVVGVALLIAFMFVPFGFVQIDTGEIAVVKVWGEAVETRTSGLHFRNIISTEYEIYDLKTQQMDIDNEVYTKDAQPMTIELTIQYTVRADKVLDIARIYGNMEVLESRIRNIAIEKSKVVLSEKNAMTLVEERNQISPNVLVAIKTLEDQYFITVDNVAVVDIAFSDAFEKAVEEKMIAQQEVTKAEAEKEKAIIKAEQDLAVAKLMAEQVLAQAKGEADAQIQIAKGEAESLKYKTIEVARMLGFDVSVTENADGTIEYEITAGTSQTQSDVKLISEYLRYIAYLEAWDGKLPEVVLDDSMSIIVAAP